jgi:hypothetical protein
VEIRITGEDVEPARADDDRRRRRADRAAVIDPPSPTAVRLRALDELASSAAHEDIDPARRRGHGSRR